MGIKLEQAIMVLALMLAVAFYGAMPLPLDGGAHHMRTPPARRCSGASQAMPTLSATRSAVKKPIPSISISW